MLCSAMTACHRLRGGIMGAPIGGPRMSPTPRSAKYGVTHGCNPSRGRGNACLWSSAPRVGRGVRCSHRGADAALCPDWRRRDGAALGRRDGAALGRRDGGDRANRANGANRWRCKQRGEHPEVGATDHNPVQRSCAGVGGYTHKMRAKGTPLATCNPLATGAYLRHAPGRGGANPGTTAVVPGYDQGCRFAALRCSQRPNLRPRGASHFFSFCYNRLGNLLLSLQAKIYFNRVTHD